MHLIKDQKFVKLTKFEKISITVHWVNAKSISPYTASLQKWFLMRLSQRYKDFGVQWVSAVFGHDFRVQ